MPGKHYELCRLQFAVRWHQIAVSRFLAECSILNSFSESAYFKLIKGDANLPLDLFKERIASVPTPPAGVKFNSSFHIP
jgi:hypothetical protein